VVNTTTGVATAGDDNVNRDVEIEDDNVNCDNEVDRKVVDNNVNDRAGEHTVLEKQTTSATPVKKSAEQAGPVGFWVQ
jgi:predicted regulator of amino acid metabolism with ACT domain